MFGISLCDKIRDNSNKTVASYLQFVIEGKAKFLLEVSENKNMIFLPI